MSATGTGYPASVEAAAPVRPVTSEPRSREVVVVLLLVLVTVLGSVGHRWLHDASVPATQVVDAATADHRYVIPPGTAARMAAGEELEVVPRHLVVVVGESLAITNDDAEVATVGPFTVAPGQTVAMRFTEPGTFGGACSVHPDGRFDVEVREA